MLSEIHAKSYGEILNTHRKLGKLFPRHSQPDTTRDGVWKFTRRLIHRMSEKNLLSYESHDTLILAPYFMQHQGFYQTFYILDDFVENIEHILPGEVGLISGREILKFLLEKVDVAQVTLVFNNPVQSGFLKNYLLARKYPW